MKLPLPKLEARLQARYEKVVKEHLSPAHLLAAGLRALPQAGKAFSSTQGLWRFLNNEGVTLPSLGGPLLSSGQQLLQDHCSHWGLVPHDWSHVRYTTHTAKPDQLKVGKGTGYTLEAALLLSDRAGAPLSPLCLHWWTARGCYTTRTLEPLPDLSYLDAVTATMKHRRAQKLSLPLCHIIDRAADSAAHLRAWDADGETFLVRGDEGHKVEWEGRSQRVSAIADALALRATHAVEWDAGVVATLFVGETMVRLTRPAYEKTARGRRVVPGAPLTLRLIVCEVRLPDDTLTARWCLLSNAPPSVSASTLVDWYYWRWRIESYFKLLKAAGWQLEQWQQATPLALFKRLCVVALAGVVVWHLQRDHTPQGAAVRTLLLRLSGRQIRPGHAPAPALLAGLFSLLSVLDVLEHYDLNDLKAIARSISFTGSG